MIVQSEEELRQLKKSGQILAYALNRLQQEAKAGVNLKFLEKLAEQIIIQSSAIPAFLNYRPTGAKKPYPSVICLSLNEVVVHKPPVNYELQEGDVLKIDLGVNYRGFFTDAAITIGIGKISETAKKIIATTKSALQEAIKKAVPNNTLGDIGNVIENEAKKNGFKIIKALTGHGIGRKLHENPNVYNFGQKGTGLKLKKGMVLAIEPMLSVSAAEIKQLPDDSYATVDGCLSTQFEHTIVIAEKQPLILTML